VGEVHSPVANRWRFGIPLLISLVVLLVVGLFAFWPMRQPTGTSGTGERVLLYHGDGFDFVYPESWRVIAPYHHYGIHGPTVIVVVGTGGFDSGCVETSDSTSCSDVQLTVPPDGVVVAYHLGAWLGRGHWPSPSIGPTDQPVRVGGRQAVLSETATSVRWAFLGAPEYIDASFGAEVADDARSQIEVLIASWRWDRAYFPH
jgi:hypothetical protein